MKVLLVNGSPHEKGCTYTALQEVANTLNRQGIRVEIFQLGTKPISGCIGCGACSKIGKCFMRDQVNEFLEKAAEADGFVFGSPVHFASGTGMMTCFMDRVFYVNYFNRILDYKPAAAVVTCRRGGATAAFDQLNKYFTISNMPVASSQYWNMVHGNTPDEIKKDLEGLQILQTLGSNMAWLMNCIKAGKSAGVDYPESKPRISTNFIR
jgi:Multimeric flavodoxin WrbA